MPGRRRQYFLWNIESLLSQNFIGNHFTTFPRPFPSAVVVSPDFNIIHCVFQTISRLFELDQQLHKQFAVESSSIKMTFQLESTRCRLKLISHSLLSFVLICASCMCTHSSKLTCRRRVLGYPSICEIYVNEKRRQMHQIEAEILQWKFFHPEIVIKDHFSLPVPVCVCRSLWQ